MGIVDVDPTLPANTLIFELRRDRELLADFREHPRHIMARYGLSEAEQTALLESDINGLRALGVHPFFLPQVSLLLKQGGWGYTDNQSESTRIFAHSIGVTIE
jgi:hypothetical protein